MKYERMLCYVRPNEKDNLLKVNKEYNIPIEFANTLEEFKSSIKDGDYGVLSYDRIDGTTPELIRSLSNYTLVFHSYLTDEEYIVSDEQFEFIEKPQSKNTPIGQFDSTEIIENYLGIIPDLDKLRYEQATAWINKPEIAAALKNAASEIENWQKKRD